MEHSRSQLPSGPLALVGPGAREPPWPSPSRHAVGRRSRSRAVRPTHRRPSRPRERLGAPVVEVADAGRDADLVIVATPDAAIADTALALAAGLRPGALVVHLSGACPVEELDKLQGERPDVQIGALHPLQSLPSVELGLERLPGSWCAVDGPPAVERLALSLGMRPFRVAPGERARVPRGRDHRVQPPRRAARPGGARRRGGGGAARGTAPAGAGERRQRRSARRASTRSPAPSRVATPTPCVATSTRCPLTNRTRTAPSRAKRSDSPVATTPRCTSCSSGDALNGRRAVITVTTIADVRAVCDAARADGSRVGFVPTMGFFHEGHRSLMRAGACRQRPRRREPVREPHAVRAQRGPRRVPPRPRRRHRRRGGRGRRRAVHCRRSTRCTPPVRAPPCTSTGSPSASAGRAGPVTSTASPPSSPSCSRSSARRGPTSAARTPSSSRSSGA